MNIAHKLYKVMQCEWWSFLQTTLFPIVAYFRLKPKGDANDPDTFVRAESHCFLTEDMTHDQQLYASKQERVLDYYFTQRQDVPIRKIQFWSDGGRAHFKNSMNYLWAAQLPQWINSRYGWTPGKIGAEGSTAADIHHDTVG